MSDPVAVGVIPDGNRRYARKLRIPLYRGYVKGVRKAEEFMDYIVERTKTRHVYFYALSLENLRKRPKTELSFLFKIFEKKAMDVLVDNRWNARVRFIGRIHELPKNTRKIIETVERKTDGNDGPTIVVAIAYTGTAEIVDMVRKVAEKVKTGLLDVKDVTESTIYENLYAPEVPPPDAIIRTSGEFRTSGFLPVQSVYSEYVFYPKLWPEMEVEDLESIYNDIRSRERRFGR